MADPMQQSGGTDATANALRQGLNQLVSALVKALSGSNNIPIGSVQATAGASAGYAPVVVGGKTYVVQIFNPS